MFILVPLHETTAPQLMLFCETISYFFTNGVHILCASTQSMEKNIGDPPITNDLFGINLPQ